MQWEPNVWPWKEKQKTKKKRNKTKTTLNQINRYLRTKVDMSAVFLGIFLKAIAEKKKHHHHHLCESSYGQSIDLLISDLWLFLLIFFLPCAIESNFQLLTQVHSFSSLSLSLSLLISLLPSHTSTHTTTLSEASDSQEQQNHPTQERSCRCVFCSSEFPLVLRSSWTAPRPSFRSGGWSVDRFVPCAPMKPIFSFFFC